VILVVLLAAGLLAAPVGAETAYSPKTGPADVQAPSAGAEPSSESAGVGASTSYTESIRGAA
jgi:hypothetical protein